MKDPVFFPVYDVRSDLLKSALGLKDNRSVEKWLHDAGIPVQSIGTRRIIRCEDLLKLSKDVETVFVPYSSKGNFSKQLDDFL